MPFTILRISKTVEGEEEVIGEFDDEKEANAVAQDARLCDPDSDYIVERPLEKPKPPTF